MAPRDESGVAPIFTADKRTYPISLEYAQTAQDEIELVLPEGYGLDGASAPDNIAHPSGLVAARYGVRFSPKTRVLSYQRERVLGNGGIAFRAESYAVLKQLLDSITRSDRHSFVLKPAGVSAQNSESATTSTAAK